MTTSAMPTHRNSGAKYPATTIGRTSTAPSNVTIAYSEAAPVRADVACGSRRSSKQSRPFVVARAAASAPDRRGRTNRPRRHPSAVVPYRPADPAAPAAPAGRSRRPGRPGRICRHRGVRASQHSHREPSPSVPLVQAPCVPAIEARRSRARRRLRPRDVDWQAHGALIRAPAGRPRRAPGRPPVPAALRSRPPSGPGRPPAPAPAAPAGPPPGRPLRPPPAPGP